MVRENNRVLKAYLSVQKYRQEEYTSERGNKSCSLNICRELLLEYVFEMLFFVLIDCEHKFALLIPLQVVHNIFFT